MRNRFCKSIIAVIVVVFLGMWQSEAHAQCAFNCNDTINVSVDFACMATIEPDMILEGADSLLCEYAVILTDAVTGVVVPGAQVNRTHVGRLFKAKVFENGNENGPSCWGYVKVEDKIPPPLMCAGNDTLMCQLEDPYRTDMIAEETLKDRVEDAINNVDGFINCDDEEVTIVVTNNVLDKSCPFDGFSAVRYVNYDIFDKDRNLLSCMDTIYYEQLPLDTIDAPKNYTEDMALNCNDPYPSVEYLISIDSESPGRNSLPNFMGQNIFEYVDSVFVETGICNLQMTYDDLIFPTCGGSYKVVRRWIVLDWCDGGTRDFHQIIKLQDTEIRITSGCDDQRDIAADPGTCTAQVELTPPMIDTSRECSDWTFLVEVKDPEATEFVAFGGNRNPTMNTIRRDFLLGLSEVRYTVTDACGNVDSCRFEIEVVDKDAPIAVCDGRTVVTLNDSFLGKVFAKSFDDGSFDGCSGIMSYKVRRVDRAETECETPADYDDFVKFCCADIGKTILVEFQVTDSVGLTSECIAAAIVQYKGPGPSITCPSDPLIQDCRTFDAFDITSLDTPIVASSNPCIADNLTPQIREVARDIDECGDGFIDIEWYINITGEEEVVCTKRIVFENTQPFLESQINWPADRTVTTCGDVPPLQTEIDALFTGDMMCTNVLPSEVQDRVFDDVPGVCRRILRTWTVVDWCRFPADPSARYTYIQSITVTNTTGPMINSTASAVSITEDPDNCQAIVSATGIAMDDCEAIMDIVWTYEVQDANGGSVVPVTQGNEVNLVLGMGSYQLLWTATDGCGNTSTAAESFIIQDNQAPTMRCGSIQRDIDPLTKDVIVTIADIDAGTFDNCDNNPELGMRRAGTNDEFSQILIFDCQELSITQIELVARDKDGNEASCIAAVDIRDPENDCNLVSSAQQVSGLIETPEGTAIEDVVLRLDPVDEGYGSMVYATDVKGEYTFEDVDAKATYMLSGNKVDDYRNGISTIDIILMQQHILGLKRLESPIKQVAADLNGNRSISATDIVLLRKLLLGQIHEFPGQPSWKFFDKTAALSQQYESPYDLPTEAMVSVDRSDETLIGIKMGDLDGNAIANSAIASGRSVEAYSLIAQTTVAEDEIVIQVKASESIEIKGMQLGIDFDPRMMSFKGVTGELIDVTYDNIAFEEGHLRAIWTEPTVEAIRAGDLLFTLTFHNRVVDNMVASSTKLTPSLKLSSEMYTKDISVRQLHFVQVLEEKEDVVLHQNKPNPFSDQTIIEFDLPEQLPVEFSIYNLNGAEVFSINQTFVAGRNVLNISKDGLGLNKGIYYYQIKTGKRSLIKKMIIL